MTFKQKLLSSLTVVGTIAFLVASYIFGNAYAHFTCNKAHGTYTAASGSVDSSCTIKH
ncbi:hypothetical protein UFOVP116_106 [uncultured Caudovirales phage]|uniref:Uncharacterized protein n=1 Tax=uncultured Caudovirales phage TaxID=2100421 RepID=A0A6J5LA38_9CAUD|nr:hypothetical protein UFOVP116_106 [uncultured Caudovirales phage]